MNRRTFVKLSGLGAAGFAVPTGCGEGTRASSADAVARIGRIGSERLVFAEDGSSFELQTARHVVIAHDDDGEELWRYSKAGMEAESLNGPSCLAVDVHGHIYVLERGNQRVMVLDSDGSFMRSIGDASTLTHPRELLIDHHGRILVTNPADHNIVAFDESGTVDAIHGGGEFEAEHFSHPSAITLDEDDNLHVVDWGNRRIQVLDLEGRHVRSYGGPGDADGALEQPSDLVVDSSGFSYVVDVFAWTIVVYDREGRYMTTLEVEQDGVRYSPRSVGLMPSGQLYVEATPFA